MVFKLLKHGKFFDEFQILAPLSRAQKIKNSDFTEFSTKVWKTSNRVLRFCVHKTVFSQKNSKMLGFSKGPFIKDVSSNFSFLTPPTYPCLLFLLNNLISKSPFDGPTYLPLWGDVLYEWSLTVNNDELGKLICS